MSLTRPRKSRRVENNTNGSTSSTRAVMDALENAVPQGVDSISSDLIVLRGLIEDLRALRSGVNADKASEIAATMEVLEKGVKKSKDKNKELEVLIVASEKEEAEAKAENAEVAASIREYSVPKGRILS